MKPITNDIKDKILIMIKNKQDISNIIKDIDIRGCILSYAIIKEFNRSGQNISGCDLSYAVIGEDGKETQLSGCIANQCSFRGAKFLGNLTLVGSDLRYSNFSETYMPYTDYRRADFRFCRFCSTVISLGSKEGYMAKFSPELLKLLTRFWIIE